MKNLLKNVEGNIYGLGVYCFKDTDGKVLYVGSGMINDRLQSHLYSLKRGRYEDTNKSILQKTYNVGLLSFEVLHFSENNSEYLHMSDSEKEAVQKALETLEQMYVNLYKDTICNKFRHITKWSTSPNEETTLRRRNANIGANNPNCGHDEKLVANILWFKEQGFKPKQIVEMLLEHDIEVTNRYISSLGVKRWIYLDAKKPEWFNEAK